MRQILLYIIFIYFLSAQAQAQQDKQISESIQSLQKEIKKVLNAEDIAKKCLIPVKQLNTDLSNVDTAAVNKNTIEKFLSANTKFINSISEKDYTAACPNQLITKLAADVKILSGKLKSYSDSSVSAQTADTIQLRLKLTDKASQTLLGAAITIDTTHHSTFFLKIISDSTGYFSIFIPADKKAANTFSALAIEVNNLSANIENDKESNSITFIKNHLFLFIAFCGSLFLAGIAGFLYTTSFFKRFRELKMKAGGNGFNKSDQQHNSSSEAIINPIPAIEEKGKTDTPAHAVSSNKYFDCEIMMTAGPRKKFMSEPGADVDLGEDVCGFTLKEDKVLIWLLDGTSDLHCLKNPVTHQDYFSSRLLAQSVAAKLKLFVEKNSGESIDKVILKILDEVKVNWLISINALPDAEKEILSKNIDNDNLPECATTVLVAQLRLDGRLTVYRSGDSKMFLYNLQDDRLTHLQTELAGKNEESNDRIFFRLGKNKHGSFDLLSNQPEFEIANQENIQTVIGCSDGIGKLTEHTLQHQYANNPDAIKAEIANQVQGTADDKSLCIFQIKSL